MTRVPTVGAIVLAGGRSERFGRDKLAEIVDGRRLVHHAIASVQAVAPEVVVAAPLRTTPEMPAGVVLVRDDRPFEGPLAGLLAALRAATAEHLVVVGGDMPGLQASVAEALLDELRSGAWAAVLEQAGRARPLPMAIDREVAYRTTRELFDSGERRRRALSDALEAVVIPEAVWRALDPQARSVVDINSPADLP